MPVPDLRPARPQDLDRAAACLDAAYADLRARLPDLPDMTGGLAEDIAAGRVWLAEEGGQVLGVMVLIGGRDHLKLANIAVMPLARGRGLARRFMDRAEQVARARGQGEMRLATHRDMAETIALYTHLGWRETGREGARVFFARAVGG